MDDEKLEQRIKDLRNNLTTDRLDMSYGEIINMYQSGDLIISPEFQRLFRWKNFQKTRFIESILLGIPIPPIFVAEDKEGKWELVDGLQRLSTVLSFFGLLKDGDKNNWIMDAGDLVPELEGYNKDKLPQIFQRNIKRAYCRVEIIKWDSKLDMRYELFNRLNTGGSALTEQEIRNCIFRGNSSDFNDYLSELSNNSEFETITNLSKNRKDELYLQELVLRFTALYNSYENIDGNVSQFLTKYMKEVTSGEKVLDFEFMKQIFIRVITLLYNNVGDKVFLSSNQQFSSSYFDGVMIGVSRNIEYYEENIEIMKQKIEELKSNKDFSYNMGSNSGSKSRLQKKVNIALKVFEPKEE